MRKKATRAEKAEQIRKSLYAAAATVVGRDGYENASISKITALAGVANGTFYNYFENRQDLFDKLLPAVGDTLMDFIRDRVDDTLTAHDKECARLAAYFEFFEANPGFLRLLNEAEVFAPVAYAEHIKRFSIRYMRALQRARDAGDLRDFSDDELRAVVYMLMGSRSYMSLMLKQESSTDAALLVKAYIKLIFPGLFATQASAACGNRATPARPDKSIESA